MAVIDVDSHFSEPFDWLDVHFPELAAKVPGLDLAAYVVSMTILIA